MHRVIITGGIRADRFTPEHSPSAEGWQVVHLTRSAKKSGRYESFRWDPESGYCDREAFRDGDAIIHLAASNIGQGRWTEARRRDIIRSRTVTGSCCTG
jgi:uncharacterized protein